MRLFLPRNLVPDSLTGGGTITHASSLDRQLSHCVYRSWRGRLQFNRDEAEIQRPEIQRSADAAANGKPLPTPSFSTGRARQKADEEKAAERTETRRGTKRHARAGRREHASRGQISVGRWRRPAFRPLRVSDALAPRHEGVPSPELFRREAGYNPSESSVAAERIPIRMQPQLSVAGGRHEREWRAAS